MPSAASGTRANARTSTIVATSSWRSCGARARPRSRNARKQRAKESRDKLPHMGTLASGLRPIAEELAGAPRVYVDANLPAGAVSAMRRELGWDVLFVIE